MKRKTEKIRLILNFYQEYKLKKDIQLTSPDDMRYNLLSQDEKLDQKQNLHLER